MGYLELSDLKSKFKYVIDKHPVPWRIAKAGEKVPEFTAEDTCIVDSQGCEVVGCSEWIRGEENFDLIVSCVNLIFDLRFYGSATLSESLDISANEVPRLSDSDRKAAVKSMPAAARVGSEGRIVKIKFGLPIAIWKELPKGLKNTDKLFGMFAWISGYIGDDDWPDGAYQAMCEEALSVFRNNYDVFKFVDFDWYDIQVAYASWCAIAAKQKNHLKTRVSYTHINKKWTNNKSYFFWYRDLEDRFGDLRVVYSLRWYDPRTMINLTEGISFRPDFEPRGVIARELREARQRLKSKIKNL